jgi:soluble lytic murein transglycosylase-like protein
VNELLNKLGQDRPHVTPSLAGPMKAESSAMTAPLKLKGRAQSFAETLDQALQPMDPMAGGRRIAATGGKPSTETVQEMCKAVAAKYGVDPAVFQALVQTESDFNPKLVSSVGAMGLAQLMPKTAEQLGVRDPFDPQQNLEGGAKYLAQMLKQFNGDMKLALAAYNAGPGAVTRAGGIPPFAETQDYVRKVTSRAENYRGR